MNGKHSVEYADGTVRHYSRKVDMTRAAEKSGKEYRTTDPKGEETFRSAGYDATAEVPAPKPAADKPAKEAKPAKAKPAKKAAGPKYGTFEVAGKEKQKCVGACGERKLVKAFPTITGRPEVRVAECRSCRDARTKKEKAAKA